MIKGAAAAIERLTLFCQDNKIAFRRDLKLSEKCTFKIGGSAALFLEPESEEQLAALSVFLRDRNIPWIVLGKGSNILFADEGFPGAVLHLGERFSKVELVDETRISCQSGTSLVSLCRFALEQELSGLEFAYGIPGSVGGAVCMNAGAYGGEMKDVLVSSRHITSGGEPGSFSGEAMGLSYRHSAYTDSGFIVTGATFSLKPGRREEIKAKMEDYMSRRREKQPLELPSAGSTFKRPEGAYASALIDRCGLKGLAVGGAMVSEKHAGFVVNSGGATCAEVLELMETVRREVLEQTGFSLVPEVRIVR